MKAKRAREEKLSPEEQEAKARLGPWGWIAERHWKEFRPKMVRELKRMGIFYQSLLKAEEAAGDMCDRLNEELWKQGVPGGQAALLARQMAMREYIYLPSEEDVPRLGESQDF